MAKTKTKNKTKTAPTNIGYSGKVKISVKNGKKTIKSTEYHNTGGEKLFRFIATCLAGDYTAAEQFRPTKIKMFLNPESSPDSASVITDETCAASGFISMNTTPIPKSDNDTTAKWKLILQFIVPYASLTRSFNQLCLYGLNIRDNSEWSACYYLADKDGNWSPIEISSSTTTKNYSLVIEWELAIANSSDL